MSLVFKTLSPSPPLSQYIRRTGRLLLVGGILVLSPMWGLQLNAEDKAQSDNASDEVSSGGNIDAGKEKSVTCQACHGADGVGITPEFPNLAGQVPGHIADQLASYKSDDPDSRNNAVMLGMVQALTEQDMADLDAFYSSLEVKPGFVSEADLEQATAGGKIYRGGYAEMQVPACMSCHGPAGRGIPPLYPRVAGQSAQYLETQLQQFKSGERKHNMMNSVAFKLTPQQMRELALFMQGIN